MEEAEKPIVAPRSPGDDQVWAAMRQLLLIIGGSIASLGYLGNADVETVVGIVMVLGSFVYGQWKTRRRAKQVVTLARHVPRRIAVQRGSKEQRRRENP